MMVWLISGLVSLAVGVVAGKLFRDSIAIFFGALIPWLGLLACCLLSPNQAEGWWPVAMIFGGTFVATVGGLTAGIVTHFSHSK